MSKANPTVQEIVSEYLAAHGYDGLAGYDCGCLADDLFPCCEQANHCQAGYKRDAADFPDADPDCEWVMSTEPKPESEES